MSTYRSATARFSPSLASLIGNLEGQQDALLAASCPVNPEVASHLATRIAIPEVGTRLQFADVAGQALSNLGYVFERADVKGATAFVASPANQPARAHEKLAFAIDAQGRFEMDHVGLGDGSCETAQRELVDAMEAAGLLFGEEVVEQHSDPRGGTLIANADKTGGGSLAERIATYIESRSVSYTTTLFDSTSSRAGQVAEGGR